MTQRINNQPLLLRDMNLSSRPVIIWPLDFLANVRVDKRKLRAVKFERIKQQS